MLQNYYSLKQKITIAYNLICIFLGKIRKRPTSVKESDSIVQNGIIAMEAMLNLKNSYQYKPSNQNYRETQRSSNIEIILPEIQTQKLINNLISEKDQEIKNFTNQKNSRPSHILIASPQSQQIDLMLPLPTMIITPDVSIITIQQQKDKNKEITSTLKPGVLIKANNPTKSMDIEYKLYSQEKNSTNLSIQTSQQKKSFQSVSVHTNTNDLDYKNRINNEKQIKTKEFGTQTNSNVR